MPGNTVSFMQPGAILAPDLSVEQAKLQRQYELAQALRQMSLEQVDGGRGPVSWTQGAAKIAQALAGRNLVRRADDKQLAVNQAYASRLGSMFGGQSKGGDPTSTPSQASDPSAPLSNIPHPIQSVDPDAAASTSSPAPSAPPAAQAGNQPGPWSLTGNPQQDMSLYAANPEEYTKSMIASHAPTDMAKTVQQAQAALARGDMATATALLQNIQKNNYIAPVNARGNSWTTDPMTGKRTYNPGLPEGSEPVFDANGNVTGVKMIDGTVQAISAVTGAKAGAEAAAKAPYELTEIVDPATGEKRLVPKSTLTGGSGNSSGGYGTLNSHYGVGGTAPVNNVSGLSPGATSAATTAGTNSANGFNEAIQGGVQAKNAIRSIDNIMSAAKNLPTGPGSGLISNVKSGVNAIAGAAGMGPVFDPSQIAHFDEMAKNAAALGDQLSNAAGGGTDARLHNALRSLPGDHYSPQAIQEVGTNLKSLQSAASARSQAAAAWQQLHGANSYPQFQQTWQRAYNPDIFYHMQKGDVAQWSKGMSAIEREHVMGQYRQMKAMGAF